MFTCTKYLPIWLVHAQHSHHCLVCSLVPSTCQYYCIPSAADRCLKWWSFIPLHNLHAKGSNHYPHCGHFHLAETKSNCLYRKDCEFHDYIRKMFISHSNTPEQWMLIFHYLTKYPQNKIKSFKLH